MLELGIEFRVRYEKGISVERQRAVSMVTGRGEPKAVGCGMAGSYPPSRHQFIEELAVHQAFTTQKLPSWRLGLCSPLDSRGSLNAVHPLHVGFH